MELVRIGVDYAENCGKCKLKHFRIYTRNREIPEAYVTGRHHKEYRDSRAGNCGWEIP